MIRLLLLAMFWGWGAVGTTQDLSDYTLRAAQDALASSDPTRASLVLDSLDRQDGLSPDGYLALGNAYYETGQYGRAILAYERGLRLRPANADLSNNLAYVREEAGLTEPGIPDFFLLRWWQQLGALLGSTTAYVLALVFWWMAVGGALWWYLRRQRMSEQRRFALLPAAVVGLLLALACYALGQSRETYLAQTDQAVLVASVADLRVSPTQEASVEDTLLEGVRLRITDRVGDYVKVVLMDGRQGYLRTTEIEII